MKIAYPVLFYEEENGKYSVFVPDLDNSSTFGNSVEDAIEMAQDLIGGVVVYKIEENENVPKPSKIENISYKKLEESLNIPNWNYKSKFKTYVSVDIDSYTQKLGKELVKKTVNIPKWVNTKAEKLNINFSKTLEEALIEKIIK